MKIRERSVDALTTVIEIEGDVDLYGAAKVSESLTHAVDEQCRRLVVDLRGVTTIDFSLIAIVAQAGRVLAQRHGTLEVVCRDGEIGRLFSAASERGRFAVRLDGDEPAEAGGEDEEA